MPIDTTNIHPPATSSQPRLEDLGAARDHLRSIAYAAAEGADSVNPEVVILACLAIARRASEATLSPVGVRSPLDRAGLGLARLKPERAAWGLGA